MKQIAVRIGGFVVNSLSFNDISSHFGITNPTIDASTAFNSTTV